MITFTEFFNDDWQRLLERVEIPGMPGASWDRKAAYLFLTKEGTAVMAPRKKAAINDSAAKIAAALAFTKLAVSTAAPDDYEDMVYLYQGWAISHDGVIAAGMPLGEQDISGYVNHKLLNTAIANVGKELVISSGDTGILIKSGDYEALVPHGDVSQYRPASPDAKAWPADDRFRAALVVAARVIKTTAEFVRDAAIYNNGEAVLATDGGSLVEAWHGNNMPKGVVFPRQFAIAVGKADKPIVGFGFDQTTWKTFTVWFEDQSFIRTNLYPYAEYPQSVPERYAAMFETSVDPIEPPKGFFEAVKAVSPFGEGNGKLAITGGAVVTGWDGTGWSTAALVKSLPEGGFYMSGNRISVWDDAKRVWFGDPQARRMVFIGDNYRAAVAAMEDPLPTPAAPPAPALDPGGWGAPPPAAPGTPGGWTAPPAAAAPAAAPVVAITLPYTPHERQPEHGGLRGSPGWDRTPYTLQPGETVAQFVNPADNEARAMYGYPLNPPLPATGAPDISTGVGGGVPAFASPAAPAPVQTENATSPSSPFPAGPGGAPTFESPAPSTAPVATETVPATASPSDRPAWMTAGQAPAGEQPAFSFAAFNSDE